MRKAYVFVKIKRQSVRTAEGAKQGEISLYKEFFQKLSRMFLKDCFFGFPHCLKMYPIRPADAEFFARGVVLLTLSMLGALCTKMITVLFENKRIRKRSKRDPATASVTLLTDPKPAASQ